MSTATSIATRSAAKAATANVVITPISDVDYNLEAYRKFKRTVINAALAVPSTTGG